MPKELDPKLIRAQVKETLEAVRDTIARTHAVVDRARQLLQELEDSRQHHRAWAEHQAEKSPRSHLPPSPAPQDSAPPPEPLPSAGPPTKNGLEVV